MESSEEDNDLVFRQRLKAAVHYTVGKICEESAADLGVRYDKQFIASLSEVTCKQIVSFANDMELFSRHAKRTTINADDVRLLIRKSPRLHQHIVSLQEETETEREEHRKKSKKSRKRRANSHDVDEDSNMAD